VNPCASNRHWSTSSVVPGYVVLSRITSWPGRRVGSRLSTAEMMNEMSGSLLFRSGVGTQITVTST
jgi:hypothetical protein